MGNVINMIGGGKPEQEKTVTAGTSVTEVTPDSSKVLSKVTVNPTPSQAKTVTPSALQQIVTPDTDKLLNKVTVAGDSDLVAGNIKKGVNLFGVNGTFDNSTGLYVWKKYTLNSEEVVNSYASPYTTPIPVGDSLQVYFSSAYSIDVDTREYVLSGVDGTDEIDAGEYRDYSYLYFFTLASNTSAFMFRCTNNFDIKADAQNAVIDVADGTDVIVYTIGAKGNFVDYVVSDDENAYPDGAAHSDGYYYERLIDGIPLECFGCTKIAIDTYTPSATTNWNGTVIPHSLGAVPKVVIILGNNVSTNYALRWAVTQDISTNPGTVASGANKNVHYYLEQSGMDSNKLTLDDTYITCGTSSTAKFIAGVEYKVITMA